MCVKEIFCCLIKELTLIFYYGMIISKNILVRLLIHKVTVEIKLVRFSFGKD